MKMGASFYGFVPEGEPVSMAYTAVERYREYLIKMRDTRVFSDERVLWGIKAFVEHPADAAKLTNLCALFKQMAVTEGVVMIYRGEKDEFYRIGM